MADSNLLIVNPITVKLIPGKNRGVIANCSMLAGETIEIAPTVAVSHIDHNIVIGTKLFDYLFIKPQDYKIKDSNSYLVFGLSSLCNHSQNPNTYIKWVDDEICSWAHLIALQNIEPGEEITLYYTNIDEYGNAPTFI
jgi:hypothetical protein